MATEPTPIPVIDWCARASKLLEIEQAILTGEVVTEARFGSDATKWQGAKIEDVSVALERAMRQCLIERGQAPRRSRFAIRGRARPY